VRLRDRRPLQGRGHTQGEPSVFSSQGHCAGPGWTHIAMITLLLLKHNYFNACPFLSLNESRVYLQSNNGAAWLIDWLVTLMDDYDWVSDYCIIEWLWLVGWLVDWLTGWLVDWLIGWLVDWLITLLNDYDWVNDYCIIEWLWLIGWLVDWLTGWLNAACLIACLLAWCSRSGLQLTIYTYYYLAQAYEKLDKKERASECLHITLKKQIELKDYDPIDWYYIQYTLKDALRAVLKQAFMPTSPLRGAPNPCGGCQEWSYKFNIFEIFLTFWLLKFWISTLKCWPQITN
jgi:hypothetical protein